MLSNPNHPSYPQCLSSCAPHQKATHRQGYGAAQYPAVVASLLQLQQWKPRFLGLPINQGWVARYPQTRVRNGVTLEERRWGSHIQSKPMVQIQLNRSTSSETSRSRMLLRTASRVLMSTHLVGAGSCPTNRTYPVGNRVVCNSCTGKELTYQKLSAYN